MRYLTIASAVVLTGHVGIAIAPPSEVRPEAKATSFSNNTDQLRRRLTCDAACPSGYYDATGGDCNVSYGIDTAAWP